MKKILSLLGAIALVGTSSVNLVNTKLLNTKLTNNNSSSKTNLTSQQSNAQTMTRYDSLNLVDEQSLNNGFSNTINNINNKADSNLNYKSFNYKQSLIKLFNNKKNIINTNNQYENFLKNKSNYQKNNLGISFPMNYNGVYFPWWGFGDYFYLYLSSSVTHEITRFINSAGSVAAGYTAILKILEKYGFSTILASVPEIDPIIIFTIMDMAANWYAREVPSFDNGNGVYLGITLLPIPIIGQVGSQDKYISKTDSFEVDYKAFDADYITACIDEQGVNFLLNYYDNYYDNNQDFILAEKYFLPYLKSLTPVDKTGWGGSITEKDYKDWGFSFWLNDSSGSDNDIKTSVLANYVSKNPDFKSIDIQTQRGSSSTWKIWKNS